MKKKKSSSIKAERGNVLVNIPRAAELLGVQYGTIRDAIEDGYVGPVRSYESRGGKTCTLISIARLEKLRLHLIDRYDSYKNEFHKSKATRLKKVGDIRSLA